MKTNLYYTAPSDAVFNEVKCDKCKRSINDLEYVNGGGLCVDCHQFEFDEMVDRQIDEDKLQRSDKESNGDLTIPH
jgi:hypothetical protein